MRATHSKKTHEKKKEREFAELHFHLGQSCEPHILWSIAHEHGIKLPRKDYWEFFNFITLINKRGKITWDHYHELYHWTEIIQSSPTAMERVVYEVLSGAYRANNLTLLEPSFNPMFRNHNGARDLDQIILGALRGMERALVEYPAIRAGLLFTLDRRLPAEVNAVIVKKAIKYRSRGIVGIDLAGPTSDNFRGLDHCFRGYDDFAPLFHLARENGLRTTVHIGEDGEHSAEEMAHVIKTLPLDRIHHGFKCVSSPSLMREITKRDLTLCMCPSSSLRMDLIHGTEHLREIVNTFYQNGIKFTINTDSPTMLNTSMKKEVAIMRDNGIMTDAQIDESMQWAREASFIPTAVGKNLYL